MALDWLTISADISDKILNIDGVAFTTPSNVVFRGVLRRYDRIDQAGNIEVQAGDTYLIFSSKSNISISRGDQITETSTSTTYQLVENPFDTRDGLKRAKVR